MCQGRQIQGIRLDVFFFSVDILNSSKKKVITEKGTKRKEEQVEDVSSSTKFRR